MTDRILQFTHSAFGKGIVSLVGIPTPPRLQRAEGPYEARPLDGRQVLVGADAGARLLRPLLSALAGMGAALNTQQGLAGAGGINAAARELGLDLGVGSEGEAAAEFAYVFDASGAGRLEDLRELFTFLQPRVARFPANGRVVILSDVPAEGAGPEQAAMASALGGFVRSLSKEAGRKGVTVNLVTVGKGAEDWVGGALRFLLSVHSAFVTGQTLPLAAAQGLQPGSTPVGSLTGRVALVTGAARGIGKSIAETLAREGATVVGMDRPSEEAELAATLAPINGQALLLDVTAEDAPERIASEFSSRFGGVDIVVHNAGVTRDKLLRNMTQQHWDMVLDINLGSILRINQRLMQGVLRDNARIVCISSIGGIAGNAGQTNYAATKAGIIGYCASLAKRLAAEGKAINAVAPGFIETQMTAAIPAVNREVGRRLSALMQGGLPVDIAEAVTFLASPLAGGVNGTTLRVCGQNFMGA
jgi:3-oxoacyl-[acyl-carrier protein] reductase